MSFKLTEEQITKAANWWADRVCAPVFNGLSKEERRDPANTSYQLAEALATMSVKPIDNSQRDSFIAALKNELASEKYNPYWGLHVDYHPCLELYNAAVASGVSPDNFPWKTDLYFKEDGTVQAASGYQSPLETI